jgi:hypothetical protein
MPLDPETITQQHELLQTYRKTLAHLLQQAAMYGGEEFAPPVTVNGIAEARRAIRRIKRVLHENGVPIADAPYDTAPRRRKPLQSSLGDGMRGDTIAGDKVGGDKVMGDQQTITTSGGISVGGDAQVVQQVTASGGTIGSIIGQQNNYNYHLPLSAPPALHQLRAPTGDFVGREDEIAQLVQALRQVAASGQLAAISGVRGLGGIGKTELAYAVAQQVEEDFPDAQLLIELRGASSNPLTPAQVLQTVIRAFERKARLSDDISELQALFRSYLSGKRVLLLADDAKDVAQIRPLIPPPGCALLITSRNKFSLPKMDTVDLGTLPVDAAKALLLEIAPRIGVTRWGACPALRLSTVGAAGERQLTGEPHVAARPDYLEQLSDERTRLAYLRDPRDPELDVEAALRLSYEALEEAARMALCQLSAFPTSFDPDAARNVVEVPTGNEVDAALENLCVLSLLEWDEKSARYNLHDLVRVFAVAQLTDREKANVAFRHAQYYTEVAAHALNGV